MTWDMMDFIANNPSSSVLVRQSDGTFCGCDIDGDVMLDSVVLADRSVVDRTPENLARPLWKDSSKEVPLPKVGCRIPVENPIPLDKIESYLEDMWEAHLRWLYNYNKCYGTNFELKKKNLKVHIMYDIPTNSMELQGFYRVVDLIKGNESL